VLPVRQERRQLRRRFRRLTPVLLHGVDFSGGADGGRGKIRVVRRDAGAGSAAIEVLGAMDRRELLDTILHGPSSALWRIDAPFGLPLETLEAHGLEASWIESARWMRGFGSPREWRTALRDRSRREPRRLCDRASSTPMAPMNLRVFKQTWSLVCEILLPLAEAGVRIEPVHAGDRGPAVAEGCPASALRLREWPARGYKGRGEPPRAVRREIVARLAEEWRGVATISRSVADAAIEDEEGDLLDAMLLVADPWQGPVPACGCVEAWVY
jgi:hypothetical protein